MYIYKLYILTLRKRQDNDVGFVDPNVVFKHPDPPPGWKAELEKNIMRFFPYNFK